MSERRRLRALERVLLTIVLVALGLIAVTHVAARADTRVGELVTHPGDVPRRLVGYGLVVGLDGSGDRSFGGASGSTPTVRSVVNLLRRFDVEVPADRLRLRNVAAVLVTAEVSPYLKAGGRFELQVAALGDASSLRGGVLWMTPLVTDAGGPAVATAQGALWMPADDGHSASMRRANAARIVDGGVLEVDPPAVPIADGRLQLRRPDLQTAARIAEAINAAFGAGTAKVDDPGSVTLNPKGGRTGMGFLASVDSLPLAILGPARIVIDARAGTIVAGGDVRIGPSVVSHHGITLAVGGPPTPPDTASSLVRVADQASVEDVAAGLHAAGARPDEVAAMFEALQSAGALNAEVIVR